MYRILLVKIFSVLHSLKYPPHLRILPLTWIFNLRNKSYGINTSEYRECCTCTILYFTKNWSKSIETDFMIFFFQIGTDLSWHHKFIIQVVQLSMYIFIQTLSLDTFWLNPMCIYIYIYIYVYIHTGCPPKFDFILNQSSWKLLILAQWNWTI